MRRTLRFSPTLVLLGLLVTDGSEALTIYRIGGPPPADPAPSVEIVHLSWDEALVGYGGFWQMLQVEDGRLAPVLLDPKRNIALEAALLGGTAFGRSQGATTGEAEDRVVDGNPDTAFGKADILGGTKGAHIGVDLGGLLPINRIVFYPTTGNPDLLVDYYRLYIVVGERPPVLVPYRYNDPETQLISDATENRSPRVEIVIPTQQAHAVMIDVGDPSNRRATDHPAWEVAEIEVYGEGFAERGSYTTRVLDLGSVSSLGQIRWRGKKDRDASVLIRTRNGADADPVRYWRYTARGEETSFRDEQGRVLTRGDYERLHVSEQAFTSHDLDNWSFWSGPYTFGDSSGTAFASPGPGQFVQFDVLFDNAAFSGGKLDYLEFEVTSPPVVRSVVGEVSPVVADAGEETDFVFAIVPTFTPAPSSAPVEPGFDRFRLTTPGVLDGVDSLRVNRETVPCELLIDGSATPCAEAVLSDTTAHVDLFLPRIEVGDSGKLMELFFRARVYRFGTVFGGEVFDSERPGEVGQSVVAGDATFLLDSNQLSVATELKVGLLQDVGVSSPAVTPNGDGVNDEISFHYSLMKLATDQRVTIDVYDLAGRRVRRVFDGLAASGRWSHTWDGRGESWRLTPGIYVYVVRLDADEGATEQAGVVSVVY